MLMKIRDGHASINNDKTEYTMPSGTVDIIAPDGRSLFSISIVSTGIEVSACSVIKIGDKLHDEGLLIQPRSSNVVRILRREYGT